MRYLDFFISTIIVVLCAATLVVMAAGVVNAQGAACMPTVDAHTVLRDQYGETVQGAGLANSGMLVEVWANVETETWTVLLTRPDGITCVMASGTGYTPGLGEAPGDDL